MRVRILRLPRVCSLTAVTLDKVRYQKQPRAEGRPDESPEHCRPHGEHAGNRCAGATLEGVRRRVTAPPADDRGPYGAHHKIDHREPDDPLVVPRGHCCVHTSI